MNGFDAVVGIDMSLTSTGIATDGGHTATVGRDGSDNETWLEREQRMALLTDQILSQMPRGRLLVILEAPAYNSKTGKAFDRAGAWWRLFTKLYGSGHVIFPVTPGTRMKYATGKGNASKDAVLIAAVKRYPDWDIHGNDEGDATVLMAIGRRLLGRPIDDPMPATHLAALATLTLPEGTSL